MLRTLSGEALVSSFVVERERFFCGSFFIIIIVEPVISHVSRTGEIKDFVITEESGIAKGIRRIVAVTGHEAAEVRRIADSLKARLDQLEVTEGKEKDAGLKSFQVVCIIFSYITAAALICSLGAEPSRYLLGIQDTAARTLRIGA